MRQRAVTRAEATARERRGAIKEAPAGRDRSGAGLDKKLACSQEAGSRYARQKNGAIEKNPGRRVRRPGEALSRAKGSTAHKSHFSGSHAAD
ncbi:hypothetical protein PTKU46_14450 [Paraburkholderia terrae]